MPTQWPGRSITDAAVTAASAAATPVGGGNACCPTLSIEKGKKHTLEEEIEACTSEDPDSNAVFWFQSPDIPVDPKKRDEMLAKYEKDTRAALNCS